MKKRLRTKKHCGEFTEWGRQLVIMRNRQDGFDEFPDVFIEEAIESNGCYCGGGGNPVLLRVFWIPAFACLRATHRLAGMTFGARGY